MARKLTKLQFSDKTSIAGEKLDAAWQDVVERFNLLDISDLKTKSFEDQFVFGYRGAVVDWEPDGVGTGHPRELPWLPGALLRNPDDVSPTRFKGADFPGVNPNGYGKWYNWEICWHAGEDPQVLDAVDMTLDVDAAGTYYPNNWQWTANTPPGLNADDYVEDVGFEVIIDHPLNPDDPSAGSVVLYRAGISVQAELVDPTQPYGSSMSPAFPGGDFCGVWLRASDLNIPIPAGARVRLIMLIPDYSTAVAEDGSNIVAGDVRWRTTVNAPWALQAYSGSVTLRLPRDAKKD
jgi:hypothetical protein